MNPIGMYTFHSFSNRTGTGKQGLRKSETHTFLNFNVGIQDRIVQSFDDRIYGILHFRKIVVVPTFCKFGSPNSEYLCGSLEIDGHCFGVECQRLRLQQIREQLLGFCELTSGARERERKNNRKNVFSNATL